MYQYIQYDYPLTFIRNIDEIPMTFDLLSNTIIDKLGIRSVSIHTIGHEKINFTVVLTCMADETKLPPIVIFKLKKILKGNFSSKVIVYVNSTE